MAIKSRSEPHESAPATKRQRTSGPVSSSSSSVPIKQSAASGSASHTEAASDVDDDEEEAAEDADEQGGDDDEEEEDVFDAFKDPQRLFSPESIEILNAAFTGASISSSSSRLDDDNDDPAPSKPIRLGADRVYTHPFPSLQLHDVFSDELVEAVREQLTTETEFKLKENDLYSYFGSGDLSDPSIAPDGSALAKIRNVLYSEEFTTFISSITGVKLLSGRPDLSSHRYYNGQYLLAHDDDIRGEEEEESEGRRIAFILYLVDPKWQREDGGSLDLFECNKKGHPVRVTHRIHPEWNSIALFEVTPTSYHTVAEVTLQTRDIAASSAPYRLSISGWFHGPLRSTLALPLSYSLFRDPPMDVNGEPLPALQLHELINPTYLESSTQKTIQTSLINDSSIELRGFLKTSIWDKLAEELARTTYPLATTGRNLIGPAHLRKYYRLGGSPVLDQVVDFFRSPEFLGLLSSFTSLEFVEGETKGRANGRLFKAGCYTLLHDQGHDPDGVEIVLGLGTKRLDADEDVEDFPRSGKRKGAAVNSSNAVNRTASVGPSSSSSSKGKGRANGSESHNGQELTESEREELEETGWTSRWGGQVCYCPQEGPAPPSSRSDGDDDGDQEDEPLTILPRPNSLSIVVRNQATVKFVKYVTASARDPHDGTPLARLDIEGMYEVDIGADDDDEIEGELVEDEEGDEEDDPAAVDAGEETVDNEADELDD